MSHHHNIIVMGASYGGVKAFSRLVSLLPGDLPAAIFIVQHFSPKADSILDRILSEKGHLPAVKAENGQTIEPGTIYVARPDYHLLVKREKMELSFGPRENRARPSIDVLFRSAAAFHTTRVIGVLLTGFLDDGVSGLATIKRCGGLAVVQDPLDAEASEMPQNAIRNLAVDHILPLDEIAARLPALAGQRAGEPVSVPEEIMEEIRISEHAVPDMENMERMGNITPFTCPECGGVLWDMEETPIPRFRCHTGHAFTLKAFLDGQTEALENSLWGAIRFMEERIKLLKRLARQEEEKERYRAAETYGKTIGELGHHVRVIRDFIMSGVLLTAVPEMGKKAGNQEQHTGPPAS